MKKLLYIIPFVAGVLATGCSKDSPFGWEDGESGTVEKEALQLSKAGGNIMVETKANDAEIDKFNVSFILDGQSIPTASYVYGEMPEVVTLKAGSYRCHASYGEDRDAEWENPYYIGESTLFQVEPMKITSYIDPIECELRNVKVTIAFDPALEAAMSKDSYVEVKVNNRGMLKYTTEEAKTEKGGYFRHTEESTLVATFYGTIEGAEVVQSKSYADVQGGRWYKLTFKLHQGGSGATGDGNGDINVDASVDIDDVNADVTIGEDEPMDDGDRPDWGGPGTPDNPDNPDDPKVTGPEFVALSDGLMFDTTWNVDSTTPCKFKVVSTAEGGFKVFTCEIISTALSAEDFADMDLGMPIDMVNTPEATATALAEFDFPCNIGGRNELEIDLSGFMGLLSALGANTHEFKIHVEDANGSATKSLILKFN